MEKRRSVCAYCGVGCEIIASVENETIVAIEGDPTGAVSRGKLCVKGRCGFDFVASPSRVSGARIRREFIEKNRGEMPDELRSKLFLLTGLDNDFLAAPIDIAVKIAAWKTAQILRESGGEAFGFIGGARTSCENAFYFQKFAREFIGSPHIDNCARVCHSPSLAGLKRTVGEGAASAPFDDILEAELIVVIGSNTTEAHPIVGLRVLEAKRLGAKLAAIDMRQITIGKSADYEMIVPLESNLLVLNAIAKEIVANDLYDREFVAARTANFDEYKAAILSDPPFDFRGAEGYENLADQISALAREIATKRTLFLWGLGVTEHIDGSDSVSAIANLALLTGNVGKRGAGLMPLRGQNNVQGACDMGCLPYYKAGYEPPNSVGLKTPEMIDAILEGKIRAIFNMGEDIAHIHPDSAKIDAALKRLDFLCVNELFASRVARAADMIIGVKSAYERGGIYINAERRVRLTEPLVASSAIDDWEFFAALKREMGGAEDAQNAEAIWEEVRRSAPRLFGAIGYDELRSAKTRGVQWLGERLYESRFHTTDSLARFYYARWKRRGFLDRRDATRFFLTTGRTLTQYNNGAQTGESPRLASKAEEDFVLISPIDAARFDLSKRHILRSANGASGALCLKEDGGVRRGTLFCTFHHARSGVNRLFGADCDAETKTPRFKAIEVAIEPTDELR